MLRKMRTMLATALVVAALLPLSAGHALAATNPGCGYSCDGMDPESIGMEDANGGFHLCKNSAITAREISIPGNGNVELRYSTYCRIAWARGIAGDGSHSIKVESFNANGTLRRTELGGGGLSYTRVVNDAGLTARACVFQFASQSYACTSRY